MQLLNLPLTTGVTVTVSESSGLITVGVTASLQQLLTMLAADTSNAALKAVATQLAALAPSLPA